MGSTEILMDRSTIARHQSRLCIKMRKLRNEQLFRRVAHAGRVVDNLHLVLDQIKNMRGRDIGEIEGRILPHKDDIEILQGPARASLLQATTDFYRQPCSLAHDHVR